jgi:uncharacterized protein YbbC (DUF1343 family)
MNTLTGLDILAQKEFQTLAERRLGVVCNQASINRQLKHILEVLLPLHQRGIFKVEAVFGPQHGLWGHTQDNMIEWKGYVDPETGLKIYSLYGEHRKPTPEMLSGLDTVIVDLQDVGSRYYTFIWTMALTMEACSKTGIPVRILDRPNPICGDRVEGTNLDMKYKSFVGLYPLPQRHGMTIGEIARYLKENYYPELDLQIIQMTGWKRPAHFPETGLSWAIPSPNMPLWATALVYPGMCLLEGTNLSEGRGTTRPFEIFGAPWIKGRKLCQLLNGLKLPGVYFRPVQFLPTFNKYKDEICEGGFIHVLDRFTYQPVLTAIALLQEIIRLYGEKFRWNDPPYEYEYHLLPIDILAGNSWLREMITGLQPLSNIRDRVMQETEEFKDIRKNYLIY